MVHHHCFTDDRRTIAGGQAQIQRSTTGSSSPLVHVHVSERAQHLPIQVERGVVIDRSVGSAIIMVEHVFQASGSTAPELSAALPELCLGWASKYTRSNVQWRASRSIKSDAASRSLKSHEKKAQVICWKLVIPGGPAALFTWCRGPTCAATRANVCSSLTHRIPRLAAQETSAEQESNASDGRLHPPPAHQPPPG
jgi:hypothetical protein